MIKKMFQRIDKILVGGLAVIIFALVQIFGEVIGIHTKIEFWILELFIIFAFLIIVIIYSIFATLKNDELIKDFKVCKVVLSNPATIYLKPNKHLNLNEVLSIYVDDGGIEKFVSLGSVTNIQKNGLIQIIMNNYPCSEEILELCKNDKNIIVKKEINQLHIQSLMKYLESEMSGNE